MQRIPRIVGRQEKSLEKFVLSPDNKWIAFLGDAGYILLCSNQVREISRRFDRTGTIF